MKINKVTRHHAKRAGEVLARRSHDRLENERTTLGRVEYQKPTIATRATGDAAI
jgi:hypothetical protein